MPYKTETEKIKLPREYDRRIKLSENDKVEIKKLYDSGMSIHGIARLYESKCCRRTIQMVIRPELRKHLAEQFIERRKDGRYKPDKESWASTMREHRAYKYKLFKEGKI